VLLIDKLDYNVTEILEGNEDFQERLMRMEALIKKKVNKMAAAN